MYMYIMIEHARFKTLEHSTKERNKKMMLDNEERKTLEKELDAIYLPTLTAEDIEAFQQNAKEAFTFDFFVEGIENTDMEVDDPPVIKMFKVAREAYMIGSFLQLDSMQEILQDIADRNYKVLKRHNLEDLVY